MTKETGGPAFPGSSKANSNWSSDPKNTSEDLDIFWYGMSLRDYFAAQAQREISVEFGFMLTAKEIAERAYEVADAMINERSK